jgi:hypothetical protein
MVKNEWNCTFMPVYAFMARTGKNSFFFKFWGPFHKILNSGCMSVCPSALNNEAPTRRIFMPIGIWDFSKHLLIRFRGPGSSVGIATDYGLDGPGIESRWGRHFSHTCRPALGPTKPHLQWVPGLFPGLKRPGRGAEHPPLSSAEIEND